MPEPQPSLHPMICAWLRSGDFGRQLLAEFVRHLARLLRNKPASFFQDQDPSEDSVVSMAGEVFRRCAQERYARYPYQGRSPFHAFCQDREPDARIRGHVFYFSLSIAKEVIVVHRRRNGARDGVLAFRDGLYRQALPVLERCARAELVGRSTLWRVSLDRPAVARTVDEVADLLHGRGAEPLDVLVPEALRLFGRPVSRGQVTQVLQRIVPLPPELLPAEREASVPPVDLADALPLRKRLLPAWRALTPVDQALCCLVMRRASAREILERLPTLTSEAAVCVAVKRVADTLLREVLAALDELGLDGAEALTEPEADPGGGAAKRPSLPPREKMQRVVWVLGTALPEVGVACPA